MSVRRLYAHQEQAVEVMKVCGNIGLGYEMGTGKTLIAIKWIHDALRDGTVTDALVVCPKQVATNWRNEIRGFRYFEGADPAIVDMMEDAVTIVSFQMVYKAEVHTVHHRDGRTSPKRRYILRPEVDKDWGAVIVDESHNLGNPKSVQTKMCLRLAERAGHRFVLSGTPLSAKVYTEDEESRGPSSKKKKKDNRSIVNYMKLYGQIKFMEPRMWKDEAEFRAQYVAGYDMWGNPNKYHEDRCKALFRDWFLVKRIRECIDLPPDIHTVIPVQVHPKARKVYNLIKSGKTKDLGMELKNSAVKGIKLLQLCSGGLRIDSENATVWPTSKSDALVTILEGLDDKVSIFCMYDLSEKVILQTLEEHFPDRKTVVFDGNSKTDTWREFQDGDADILVCKYQCGSFGINLQNSCHLIYWEPTRVWMDYDQTIGRILRSGQKHTCEFIYLVTQGTVESDVWEQIWSGSDVMDKDLELIVERLAAGQKIDINRSN